MGRKGIVVLGHPRSGTTLLRRILNGHSQIASPPETHLLSACARFLDAERTDKGVDVGALSGLNFAGFDDETTIAELRDFAFSFFERYASTQSKPRWAEKTAYDAFHIEQIELLCAGHAQFVGVVRHPLDVAISTKSFCDSMGMFPSVLHPYIKENPYPVEAFAHSWRDVNLKLSAFCERNPETSKLLRYEDLIERPDETISELMQFLGEVHEPDIVETGLGKAGQIGFGDHKSYQSSGLHKDSVARWKSLPTHQIGKLAPVLNPLMTKLGYEALDEAEDAGVDKARAQYAQGLDLLSKRASIESSAPLRVVEKPAVLTAPQRNFASWYGRRIFVQPEKSFIVKVSVPAAECDALGLGTDQNTTVTAMSAALIALMNRTTDESVLSLNVYTSTDPRTLTVIAPEAPLKGEGLLSDVQSQLDNGVAATEQSAMRLACEFASLPNASGEAVASAGFEVTTGNAQDDADLSVKAYFDAVGLHLSFQVLQGLWETEEQAKRTAQHYLSVLKALSKPDGLTIGQIDLLADEERKVLFPEPARLSEAAPRVIDAFISQATAHPDKLAVTCGDTRLSYSELSDKVFRLSAYLQNRGVKTGTLVAVCVNRSVDMVTALLAVMHAGGVYIPIDPDHPSSRINLILEDAAPQVLVTERSIRDKLGATNDQSICLDENDWENTPPKPVPSDCGDLVYIIFTSGSTGRPKGVEVRHHGLSTFLAAMAMAPGLTTDDNLLSVTTVAFDIAALEIFLPLVNGATVHIVRRGDTMDARALRTLIDDNNITFMQATPATYQILITSGWEGRADLKLLCGGEALPPELVENLLSRCDQLWNMYGPTETTIWSTVKHLTDAERPISIGQAIAGTRTYVLNPEGLPVPIGTPGELHIAGDGVSAGYHKRPELTDEKFVPDSLSDGHDDIMYRTGDVVRMRENGDIEYLGRSDNQVKIRGFRIELGDIEAALGELEAVKQCVVGVHERSARQKVLVAYVIPSKAGQTLDKSNLHTHLANRLPEYMIPTAVVNLDAFPLTPNNKIDRKALPAPKSTDFGRARIEKTAPVETPKPAGNAVQSEVIAEWEKIIGIAPIDPDASFISLGGDSLSFVQAAMVLEDKIGQLPEGWEEMPIRSLVNTAVVEEVKTHADIDISVALRALGIALVVLLHSGSSVAVHGASSGLFLVAGYLFAKFQFTRVTEAQSPMPVVSSALQILLPSTLYMLALQLFMGDFNLDVLLLYSNLFEPTQTYWFVQCLMQFLLVMFLIFLIPSLRKTASKSPLVFGAGLLLASGLALIVANSLLPDDHRYAYQMPYIRFWQFALGWCAFFSTSIWLRTGLVGALLLLAGAEYVFFQSHLGRDYFVVSVMLALALLFVPKITLARPLHHVVYALAGASLFIFLSHRQFFAAAEIVYPNAHPLILTTVGLAGGYVLWLLWDMSAQKVKQKMSANTLKQDMG